MNDPKFPSFQVPDEIRNVAERGVEQGRKAIDTYLDAIQRMLDAVQDANPAFRGPAGDMARKTLNFTQQNMKAAFDHGQRLLRAKDLQEAMQIHAEFLKEQFTTVQEQLKDLGGGVQQAASDMTKAAQEQVRDAAGTLRRAAGARTSQRP